MAVVQPSVGEGDFKGGTHGVGEDTVERIDLLGPAPS